MRKKKPERTNLGRGERYRHEEEKNREREKKGSKLCIRHVQGQRRRERSEGNVGEGKLERIGFGRGERYKHEEED